MKRFTTLLVGLAIAATPLVASAQPAVQTGMVQFAGDQSSNGQIGGYAVGPYLANNSGFATTALNGSNLIIWCIDFTHVANSSFDSYYATRLFGAGTDVSQTRLMDLNKYLQAAWMIEQYDPMSSVYSAGNIQGTLWAMSGSGITPSSSATDSYTQMLAAPSNFTLTRNWYVLSDYLSGNETVSNQEYLISVSTVPEPSTYALMGAGLAALALVARRRRTAVRIA